MGSSSVLDGDVQVRADGSRVIVLLSGRLDGRFAQVLGEGLAAALDAGGGLVVDVSGVIADDSPSLRALGQMIDVVIASGHDVGVRGARNEVAAYLRLRSDVSFVTQL